MEEAPATCVQYAVAQALGIPVEEALSSLQATYCGLVDKGGDPTDLGNLDKNHFHHNVV